MTETNRTLVEDVPKKLGEQKNQKPSACKITNMPFDQRTLEAWVR